MDSFSLNSHSLGKKEPSDLKVLKIDRVLSRRNHHFLHFIADDRRLAFWNRRFFRSITLGFLENFNTLRGGPSTPEKISLLSLWLFLKKQNSLWQPCDKLTKFLFWKKPLSNAVIAFCIRRTSASHRLISVLTRSFLNFTSTIPAGSRMPLLFEIGFLIRNNAIKIQKVPELIRIHWHLTFRKSKFINSK